METRKTVLGLEHLSTLNIMGSLASTCHNQGRWMEAEKLEVQVVEKRQTVLGHEHPDTLTSMYNLVEYWRGFCHAFRLAVAAIVLGWAS